MFSNFFGKWFGDYKSNDKNLSPPPSDPRQSQTLSLTATNSCFQRNLSPISISIDYNIPDEFESKYDTPPMSLKRYLTDHQQQTSRQSSLFSSLSCDSSLHSKTVEKNEKMPFCDILLPPCTPPLNFLKSSPPLLPEIDEDFFPPSPFPPMQNYTQQSRSSSLPQAQKFNGLLYNFEEDKNFMNSILPTQLIPDFQNESQTPSENCFIDEMMPLTISSSFNSRNRHFHPEFPPFQAMSPMIFKSGCMNQASLFQEEQELSSDYVIGGYAPLYFGEEISEKNYIVRKLGFGHFSTVWLCYDTVKKAYNAVKVSRSDPAYAQNCVDEIRFLQCIADFSACRGSDRVVKLLNEFSYTSPFGVHCCASQEPLGRSLYQLIVQYDQIGFSLPVIQKLAYHLLEGLNFLHNNCGIIHTDLKPENVTINCNPEDLYFLTKNALIDFVIAKKSAFAHAHFPPNITDILEYANSNIYFESVKKLERSRQEFLKNIWRNEFKETEGEYEEFARICREKDINAMFGDTVESYDRRESNGSSNDERCDDIETFLLNNKVNFQIVDLGTAQYRDNVTATQFQTLQYRCPEVVLKHEITPAIDIWSLACVLFEAATGDYLFNPRGNRDDLDRNRASYDLFCCFISILGSPPTDLKFIFPKNAIYAKLFDKNGKFINEPNFGSPSLTDHIRRHIDENEVEMFISFMERMLCFNPERRGSAKDLLEHKWFKNFGYENCDK